MLYTLKLYTVLDVNYTSIKLGEKRKKNKAHSISLKHAEASESPGSQPGTNPTTQKPPEARRKGRELQEVAPEPRGRAGGERVERGGWQWGGGEGGRPAHQLHAQAILLPGVVAVNLLLDLLQRGRAPRLLHGFADILQQTQM